MGHLAAWVPRSAPAPGEMAQVGHCAQRAPRLVVAAGGTEGVAHLMWTPRLVLAAARIEGVAHLMWTPRLVLAAGSIEEVPHLMWTPVPASRRSVRRSAGPSPPLWAASIRVNRSQRSPDQLALIDPHECWVPPECPGRRVWSRPAPNWQLHRPCEAFSLARDLRRLDTRRAQSLTEMKYRCP
jgi:hypothetical protein